MGIPPESSYKGSVLPRFARGLVESTIASLIAWVITSPSTGGPLWSVIRTAIYLWVLIGLPLFLLCDRIKCRGHIEIWL